MRSLRICFFSPDRHLSYDGKTPDTIGAGGGVTARVRLACALSRMGHQVTVVCNCPREGVFSRVRYLPLRQVRSIETDILILHTTGGGLDLRSILDLEIRCLLRIVWLGGYQKPHGVDEVSLDYIVAPSNFVRRVVRDQWGIPSNKIFVAYNGIERAFYRIFWNLQRRRNLFRLVYVGHPEKGLNAAMAVLRLVRAHDQQFELHVFGGYRLWGEEDKAIDPEPGLVYHGLVNQRQLARELTISGFSLNLQATPEGFGIAVSEAMAAGCIVLASPIGALSEIVHHGLDGFLVPGDHTVLDTQQRATRMILTLAHRGAFADYIRRNAIAAPLDWDTVARVWEGLWAWTLDEADYSHIHLDELVPCSECGRGQLLLADGYHCTDCGRRGRMP